MPKLPLILTVVVFVLIFLGTVLKDFEQDVIKTSQADLKITFIGHATLMFAFGDKVIHVDPVGSEADYSTFPKADIILVTHEHSDHLDPAAIAMLRTEKTDILFSEKCAEKVKGGIIIRNGDSRVVQGIKIEAVPAYNIIHMRSAGMPFHPKGQGNGYLLTFADKRVYVAGDTENVPEIKTLKGVAIAFLPMNLPYTMTPEMVADVARAIKPEILYPYHFGETDTSKLVDLLKDQKEIDVRIRKLK